MKRVALFLEENQIKKAKALAKKISTPWVKAPWSDVVRRALDFYFFALKDTKIKPRLKDSRVGPRNSRREPDIAARAWAKIRKEKEAGKKESQRMRIVPSRN